MDSRRRCVTLSGLFCGLVVLMTISFSGSASFSEEAPPTSERELPEREQTAQIIRHQDAEEGQVVSAQGSNDRSAEITGKNDSPCSPPVIPDNGYIVNLDGTKVQINCNDGYKLEGPEELNCIPSPCPGCNRGSWVPEEEYKCREDFSETAHFEPDTHYPTVQEQFAIPNVIEIQPLQDTAEESNPEYTLVEAKKKGKKKSVKSSAEYPEEEPHLKQENEEVNVDVPRHQKEHLLENKSEFLPQEQYTEEVHQEAIVNSIPEVSRDRELEEIHHDGYVWSENPEPKDESQSEDHVAPLNHKEPEPDYKAVPGVDVNCYNAGNEINNEMQHAEDVNTMAEHRSEQDETTRHPEIEQQSQEGVYQEFSEDEEHRLHHQHLFENTNPNPTKKTLYTTPQTQVLEDPSDHVIPEHYREKHHRTQKLKLKELKQLHLREEYLRYKDMAENYDGEKLKEVIGMETKKIKDAQCPEPEVPEHSTLVGTDTSIGSVVYIQCDPGYTLSGPDRIICLTLPDSFPPEGIWEPQVVGKCRAIQLLDRYPPECSLPKVVGPCKALLSRFYFDSETKECLPFNYGGCNGNDNNFESKEACETFCHFQQIY